MGGARAFTTKLVMLRSNPTGQAGIIGIGGLGHWKLLCRRTCELQTPAPNGRMHFVGVKFAGTIGG
jgi:hypothetical protein